MARFVSLLVALKSSNCAAEKLEYLGDIESRPLLECSQIPNHVTRAFLELSTNPSPVIHDISFIFKTSKQTVISQTENTSPTMSQPPSDLHQAIIDYVTKRSRIMFTHKLSVWEDFATQTDYKYADYSHENLRDEFIKTILPRIFTFELTEVQKRKVEIFADHHNFLRTTHGFQRVDLRRTEPVEGVDFVREGNEAQFPDVACVIRSAEAPPSAPRPDLKIAAWTSAVNSTDIDLADFTFHRGPQLHKIVEQNARLFQTTNECPPNLHPTVNKKIIAFRQKADEMTTLTREELLQEE